MKNRVKELREEKGYTQEQLATMVGVTRYTIISLEKGRFNPSIMLAWNLSKIFSLTIEEVFIFEDDENACK